MQIIKKIDEHFFSKSHNFDMSYYYWCDKLELQKLVLSVNTHINNQNFIPCYPYDDDISYVDLVGKNLLIFLKNPKIFYGILKIESVLIKKKKEINYLDNNDIIKYNSEEEINLLETNDLIEINKNKYESLISKYNMVEIPKLFFVKFDNINVFDYEIDIKSLNQYLSSNINEFNPINIKFKKFDYPNKIKIKNITKSYYQNLEPLIINYLKYLKKISTEEKNILINNLSMETNNNDTTDLMVHFDIPILWNGCDTLLKKMKEFNINKKTLLEHWNVCKECEIINNNTNNLELKNKKIVIKNIKSKENYQCIINKIISDYQNIKKFSHPKTNVDFTFEDDKINLICYFDVSEHDNIYKNCFFVLNKYYI